MSVFKRKRPRSWLKIVLYTVVIGAGAWWQLRDVFPPPTCTPEKAAGYSGKEMYDFAFKRKVLWNKNPTEAACWFERSADAGYSLAATSIGRAYEKGEGVPVDVPKAIVWYEKAIAMDNSGGAYRLGKLYDEGTLVPRDEARALDYLKQAARMGNSGTIKRLNDAGIDWQTEVQP